LHAQAAEAERVALVCEQGPTAVVMPGGWSRQPPGSLA